MRPATGPRISENGPIDTDRLDVQTAGDVALQRELLDLLCGQIDRFSGLLAKAGEAERAEIAHALKGAAGAVGAVALETAARRCEEDPSADERRQALAAEMQRLSAFVHGLEG